MLSRSAITRIAASETQPAFCSCARHNTGMTAEAWRPAGYFAICCFTQTRFSSVNAKLAGCNSFGARRRTDIILFLAIDSADVAGEAAQPLFPERTLRGEHVVADVA